MAKKMSKRKTNAIVLGVTLTLVMVLLGGVIAAVVTETNPKDWFKQEIKYSTYGEEITKEYDAFYFDATEYTVSTIFENLPKEDNASAILAYFGDGSRKNMMELSYTCCEEGYVLEAVRITIDSTLVDVIWLYPADGGNDRLVIYASSAFDIEGQMIAERGFQNLGEDGRLEWDGEAITGAIYHESNDKQVEYNGISITPIK